MRPLWARYVGAMLYFMGAALIAGGVVHYPIDPPQYAVITVVGALVFALGTVFNEFVLAPERPTVRRAVGVVTASLFLSLGVGLTGGGIQHFDQFPERCAIMTPLGLTVSYIAFVAKDAEGRWRNLLGPFAVGVGAVALAVWLGMTALAGTIDSTEHSHVGGGGPTPAPERVQEDPAPVSEPVQGDHHEDHHGAGDAPHDH